MKRAAHILTHMAFWLTAALAALAALFVVGVTFDDPGGWEALGVVALWLAPLVVLVVVARLWPALAAWVFGGYLVAYSVITAWEVADPQWWKDFQDSVGPVLGLSALVLALPLAVLGLRRQITAGLMLVATATIPFVGFAWSRAGEGPHGLGSMLTTSQTILCLPLLVVGLLFLLAGLLGRAGAPAPPATPTPTPTSEPPVAAGSGGTTV